MLGVKRTVTPLYLREVPSGRPVLINKIQVGKPGCYVLDEPGWEEAVRKIVNGETVDESLAHGSFGENNDLSNSVSAEQPQAQAQRA